MIALCLVKVDKEGLHNKLFDWYLISQCIVKHRNFETMKATWETIEMLALFRNIIVIMVSHSSDLVFLCEKKVSQIKIPYLIMNMISHSWNLGTTNHIAGID